MLRVIWKKSFKKMRRKMEYKMREETIKKVQGLENDNVAYLNGFDDGFYRACEDILKWMEGKKDKKN